MHNLLFGLALSDCLKIWPDFNYEFFGLPMYIYLLPRYIYTQMKANYECVNDVGMVQGCEVMTQDAWTPAFLKFIFVAKGKCFVFLHIYFSNNNCDSCSDN